VVGFLPSGKAVPIAAGFRPRGNSLQLSAAFFGDLHRVWEVEGIGALSRMAKSDPIRFCEMVANLSRVVRMELGPAGSFEQPRTREELLAKVEERTGPKGREVMAKFLDTLDQMEKEGA
jgi:hypothetical protein